VNFRPLVQFERFKRLQLLQLYLEVVFAADFLQESATFFYNLRVPVNRQRLQIGQGQHVFARRPLRPLNGTAEQQWVGAEVVVVGMSDEQVPDFVKFNLSPQSGMRQIGWAIN
jgi:hypothetical protein